MAKIVALDIGMKRTGIAESDALQMMAFPLVTVYTEELMGFLRSRMLEEPCEELVVGAPTRWDGSASEVANFINDLCEKIQSTWPQLRIVRVDERFTSSLASDALLRGGMKKSKRQEKGAVDKVAAALILENYLAQR
jgi:putative Holliday junction resolvase